MVANLNTRAGRRPSYVKLRARIELRARRGCGAGEGGDAAPAGPVPDLSARNAARGVARSAGTWRLREELLARANVAVAPARVVDVLFTEMLMQ